MKTSQTGRLAIYAGLLLLFQLSGCSERPKPPQQQAMAKSEQPVAQGRLVLAFGDSLFAGYQLRQDEGFAPALGRALAARGIGADVVNGGVSGDTSAAGLRRLDFVLDGLARKPDLVIVGLGANDMLRGFDPAVPRKNLGAILEELKRREIPVMLAGMRAAPNMGADYAAQFEAIYPELAQQFDVPLYPFFLDGVVDHPELELADHMHPNAAGAMVIADRIAPEVAKLLE